jgi:hypothetical protein
MQHYSYIESNNEPAAAGPARSVRGIEGNLHEKVDWVIFFFRMASSS